MRVRSWERPLGEEETGRMGEDGGEAERVLGQGWGALG